MPDIFIGEDRKPEVKPEEIKIKPSDKAADETQHVKTHSKHRHSHIFSAYCANPPREVVFANSGDNEELLLFLRRHFITNLPWILKALALAIIPIILEIFNSFGLFSIQFLTTPDKTIIYFFYYFFIFGGYIFVNYVTWFYNISLVTNERIIDIDFSDVVFENVSATKLSQIEDVTYSQIGVSRSLFDYGDVLVETAASTNEFEFASVPHPEEVIKVIDSLIGNRRHA